MIKWKTLTCEFYFLVDLLTLDHICPPPDGGGDQSAAVWSSQNHHGVQWRWGGGSSQAVRGGAGHHDPAPRGRGETDRSQHHPGNSLCFHKISMQMFCCSFWGSWLLWERRGAKGLCSAGKLSYRLRGINRTEDQADPSCNSPPSASSSDCDLCVRWKRLSSVWFGYSYRCSHVNFNVLPTCELI